MEMNAGNLRSTGIKEEPLDHGEPLDESSREQQSMDLFEFKSIKEEPHSPDPMSHVLETVIKEEADTPQQNDKSITLPSSTCEQRTTIKMSFRKAREVKNLMEADFGESANDATSEEEDTEQEERHSEISEESCSKSDDEDYVPDNYLNFDDSLDQDVERAISRKRRRSPSQGFPRDRPRSRERTGRSRERPSTSILGRNEYKWRTTPPTRSSSTKSSSQIHLPQPVREARNVSSPSDSWRLLLPDTLIAKLVEHTNAEIQRSRVALEERAYHKETNDVEIKALIGLFYIAGVFKCSKCNAEDLWSPKYGVTQFRSTMSYNRFQFLVKCLRFDDKETRTKRLQADRLAPIREIWNEFIENCRKYYSPSEFCTLNEQLLGFRGKCQFRMHTKNKPDKYGLKLVMLNDAETGYMLNASPYTGEVHKERSETIPEYYVRTLTTPIHGSDRNVTTDNWFTSVPIVQKMLTDYSLTMIGTIRKNEMEIPESFKAARPAGSALCAYDDNKMLLSYAPKKNKILLVLSSLNQNPGNDEETGKPAVIAAYNETKGGTDLFHQFCCRHTVTRRTDRWSLRFFYGMLDQAGVNSCILYNLNANNVQMPHRKFLQMLSFSLIEPALRLRLTSISLTKSLRACVTEVLGIEIPPPQERTSKLVKPLRCRLCPWKSDRKTSNACFICRVPICPEHRFAVCNTCAHE